MANLTTTFATMDVSYTSPGDTDLMTVAGATDLINTLIGPGIPGPFTLTGSVDASGNAILNWSQSSTATHYKVFADGVGGSDLGDVYGTDHNAGSLTVGVPKAFFVRAWSTSETNFRDTAEVTLTRAGAVGPTIVHHVSGLTPESGTAPSLTPSVGPALTFTRATPAMGLYHDGTWRRVTSGQPFFADISRAENLFANSDTPATQTLTNLFCTQYRVEVWGTGSVTLAGTDSNSGAVTEAGGAVIFDHHAQNVDFETVTATVSGTLTKFQLTAGTEAHAYIASGAVRYGYVASKRGRLRLIGGETPLNNFAHGAKGPTAWTNLALANRADSTHRGPWLARMYELKENTATGQHGLGTTIGGWAAGTYYLLIYASAGVAGDRSLGFGLSDTGGARWAFINPTTGTINATPTEGSPITTGYSCTRRSDGGYLIQWTHTGTQGLTFINRHLNGANATSTSALSFTGATTNLTRSIGWFIKSGSPWMMPQLYADGARAQEYGTYTLTTEFDTSGSTFRWRGVFVSGPSATNRTILAGGNVLLRRNTSGYIELVVGAMTLTHGTVIANDTGVSVAVRIKAGDYAIAVDSAGTVTSTNAATPNAITTLYRGVDTSVANPAHEEWSVFELHADAHDNATLNAWTVAQGTGGGGSIVPRFRPATHGGLYVRVPKSWTSQSVRGQVTSGTTNLQQLQSIVARNGGNGMANMVGVVFVFPWSEIQPTATTWNWTGVDECSAYCEAAGFAYWIQVQDRNYWRANVTCPSFVQTRSAADPGIGAYDSLAADLASVMEQKRVVNAAICSRLRNKSLFLGLQEPETSLSTMTALGMTGKAAHWANLITMRSALSAEFKELVFLSEVNGMNLEKWRFEQQADSCISLGNCGWSWPDSPTAVVNQVPIADNNLFWYHFQIARTSAYNQKMAIIPGVQNQQIDGNYSAVSQIVNHLASVEKAHAAIMEPDFSGYANWWTEVVLRLATEVTFNQDIPWTSTIET